jgi:hypothetical protein
MSDYTINVTQIEELQTIANTSALENIFDKAKSAVVQGGVVNLVRKKENGSGDKFDEISTEADLDAYKKSVFKYL